MFNRRIIALRAGGVTIAVVAFVVLGMPESGLGAAWPAMRTDLGRPVADLGTLLVAAVAAYALTSAAAGRLVERLGTGTTSALATGLSLAGLVGYATAPTWIGVVAAAVVTGAGGGMLDTTLNAHAAHHFTPGATNLLHAGFGIGATIGPVVVSGLVASGAGWRPAYVLFAAVEAVLLIALLAMRRDWPAPPTPDPEAAAPVSAGGIALLGILLFFVYTGLEVTAGQWAFTVLVEGERQMATATAGLWVASYWGAITAGRLALSAVATRVGPDRILGFSMAGSVAGAALFWWDPAVGAPSLGVLGLPLLGISLAGVFPTLVTLTPVRVGALAATRMIGYQLAAASVGAAVLPWVTGRVLEQWTLATLGPLLVVAAATMAALHIVLDRMARRSPTAVPSS